MKPLVGQMVLYQRYGTPNGEHSPEVSPAIITKVIEDGERCVLFVMTPNGTFFNEVPYSYDFKPGHWSYTDGNRRGHGLLKEIEKGIVSKKEMEVFGD